MGCLVSRQENTRVEHYDSKTASHRTRTRTLTKRKGQQAVSNRGAQQEFKGIPGDSDASLMDSNRASRVRRQRVAQKKSSGEGATDATPGAAKSRGARRTRVRPAKSDLTATEGHGQKHHVAHNPLLPGGAGEYNNGGGADFGHRAANSGRHPPNTHGLDGGGGMEDVFGPHGGGGARALTSNMFQESSNEETSSVQLSNRQESGKLAGPKVKAGLDYEVMSEAKLIVMREWLDHLLTCMSRTSPQDPQLVAAQRKGGNTSTATIAALPVSHNASSPSTMAQAVSPSENSLSSSLREQSGEKMNPSLNDQPPKTVQP